MKKFTKKLYKIFLGPSVFRVFFIKKISQYKLGSFEERVNLGATLYPRYAYPLYHGAKLAKKLGLTKISTIEFGVAGGGGLVALENLAKEIEQELDIQIEVYGFDAAEGLPKPIDYRDVPYYWQQGFYKMDVPKLKSKLSKAQLILGDVAETVKSFASYDPAPIAAVMIDLDYYSSTKAALEIFNLPDKYLLPRIFCYFDDVRGTEDFLATEYSGERLAISEFNLENQYKKIDKFHYLEGRSFTSEKFFGWRIFHSLRHPQYNTFIGVENRQLDLN